MQIATIHALDAPRPSWAVALRTAYPAGVLAALACLYAALAPSIKLLPTREIFDSHRLVEVSLLLSAGLVLSGSKRARTAWLVVFHTLPAAARWGLVLVMMVGCISALSAAMPLYGLLEVSHFVLLFCLAVFVADAYRQSPAQAEKMLLAAASAGALLYLISFAVSYTVSLAGLAPLWPRSLPGFSNVRFFNQFQVWTLSLLVLPVVLWPTVRRASMVLASGWWMLAFASGGRGLLLGIGIAVVFVLLVYGKRAAEWVRLQFASALAGGAAFFILFKVVASTNASILDRDLGHFGDRLALLQDAWGMLFHHPLLGVGPMHFAFYQSGNIGAHPHNALAQMAAEWGAPVALILLVLGIWGLSHWVGTSRKQVRADDGTQRAAVVAAITASLVAASVLAMFDGVIVMPISQVLLALLTGWAWGMILDGGLAVSTTPGNGVPLCMITIAAICCTSVAVARDAFVLADRQMEIAESTHSMRLLPRFWQQGVIGSGHGEDWCQGCSWSSAPDATASGIQR